MQRHVRRTRQHLPWKKTVTLAPDLTVRKAHLPHPFVAFHYGHFAHTHCLGVAFRTEHQRISAILLPNLGACRLSSSPNKPNFRYIGRQPRLNQHHGRYVREGLLHVLRKLIPSQNYSLHRMRYHVSSCWPYRRLIYLWKDSTPGNESISMDTLLVTLIETTVCRLFSNISC